MTGKGLGLIAATIWVVLWSLISLLENIGYVHDPTAPGWQIPAIVLPSVIVAGSVAYGFLFIRPFESAFNANPGRWLLLALALTPALICIDMLFSNGVRVGLFALGGATYRHRGWLSYLAFESLKVPLLYALWLGLVFGAKIFMRWQEERTTLLEIQKSLAESKLSQLKEQLRPHFLFNALNTISALMQTDIARADRLIARLADLLRATLSADDRDLLPLADELRLLRLYAEIMCERFSDRVTIAWDVAQEALDVMVPAMMLQPLLENAFRHGVEANAGAHTIIVSAQMNADYLEVKIRSQGALNQRARDGIGLTNCRERLRIHYGATASITLEGEPQAAVSAKLLIPRQAAA